MIKESETKGFSLEDILEVLPEVVNNVARISRRGLEKDDYTGLLWIAGHRAFNRKKDEYKGEHLRRYVLLSMYNAAKDLTRRSNSESKRMVCDADKVDNLPYCAYDPRPSYHARIDVQKVMEHHPESVECVLRALDSNPTRAYAFKYKTSAGANYAYRRDLATLRKDLRG